MRTLSLSGQKITGDRVVSALQEGIAHNPRELAGHKNFHSARASATRLPLNVISVLKFRNSASVSRHAFIIRNNVPHINGGIP